MLLHLDSSFLLVSFPEKVNKTRLVVPGLSQDPATSSGDSSDTIVPMGSEWISVSCSEGSMLREALLLRLADVWLDDSVDTWGRDKEHFFSLSRLLTTEISGVMVVAA